MNAQKLVVKCYAERQGDQWIGVCLDFDLAAQADTLDETKAKLHAMVVDYVCDALVGEDRQHAEQLLSRRAPAYLYAKWYGVKALSRLRRLAGSVRDGVAAFTDILPVKPA